MKHKSTMLELFYRFLALKVDRLQFSEAIVYFQKDEKGISPAISDFREFIRANSNQEKRCERLECTNCPQLEVCLEIRCRYKCRGFIETIRLNKEQFDQIKSILRL